LRTGTGWSTNTGGTDIAKKAREMVAGYMRQWEAINVFVAYRKLLRSPELLGHIGEGIFSRWDLELLHADAPKQGTPFRFSDLGALLYLRVLLDGIESERRLDHIVVDEAQDMTPLQFLVLRRFSRNQSMTIMGDMAQGIYSDHGLHQWEELHEVFDRAVMDQHTLEQSYRSTQEIIQYANDLMRRTGLDGGVFAKPITRSGDAVVEKGFSLLSEQVRYLCDGIRSAQRKGRLTIAVLTRTAKRARELAPHVAESITDLQLIDGREKTYDGGVAILPVYLAKGLEFDVVFVADADAASYQPQLLDARLLYVAITRASHQLFVSWVGERTELLDDTRPQIHLGDYFAEHLQLENTTLATYAAGGAGHLTADTYVERLASAGKLHLLEDGRIDRVTLGVLAQNWRQSSQDEEDAPELDPVIQQAVRLSVSNSVASGAAQEQEAAAFLQLTHGILRNVLAGVGIKLEADQEDDLLEQAVGLTRFLHAVRWAGLTYAVGSPTTEKRIFDAVSKERRDVAKRQLSLLQDHGIVEVLEQMKVPRLRITVEWIENLVAAALGHRAGQWDDDLWPQWSHFSAPISQQVLASDMVLVVKE
jgi:DNA helicase-2/ATP-dependent DNA helicase PcrA